jgi:phosphatidylglycerol:prolipoprotein diacylglycerol transferase
MCPLLHMNVFGLDITVAAYTLFAALGVLAGTILAIVMLRRERLNPLRSLVMMLCMAVCFLPGARLWNYLANPGAYGKTLFLLSIKMTGFSLYGGILGAFIALLCIAWLYRRNPWPLLDALVLPSAAAFALVRVGCYLNGCCGGISTFSFLGVHFPQKANSTGLLPNSIPFLGDIADMPVYPTQIFELLLALLGLIPALWLYFRKRAPTGVPFLVYGIWFTAMRWGILYIREMPYPSYVTEIIYPVIYAAVIGCGVALLIFKMRQKIRKDMRETRIR